MKISSMSNVQSFGKTPLMTCMVKSAETQKPQNATLYKMDPHNEDDKLDIKYSKNTISIKSDFYKEANYDIKNKDFYVMQNDKTGEVISCAETSHRYKPSNSPYSGLYTLIEEMDQNKNYINGSEPVLAYIVKNAEENFDKSVYTAFGEEQISDLKSANFKENELGEFYITKNNFSTLINQAEKNSKMEYII